MNKNIQISKEVNSKYKKKKIISAILLGIILVAGIYFYSQTGVPSEFNKSPETPKETITPQPETESNLPPLPPSRSFQVSESNTSEELPPPEPPRTPETPPSKGSEERNLPPLPPSRQ